MSSLSSSPPSPSNVDSQKENTNSNTSKGNASSTTSTKGIAGRINYGEWDRVTSDLLNETEQEEEHEKEQTAKALGLDGKYARSEAEAAERIKAKQVKQAKKTLDKYKKRESAVVQQFSNVFLTENAGTEKKIVRVTRDTMEAGKRVLSLDGSTGLTANAKDSTIIVTQDLSHLECSMPANTMQQPKSYEGDVDNGRPDEKPEMRKVFGLIKIFIANMKNCTIVIRSKVISGTIEMNHCDNVIVKVEKDATVATIQLDLCQNCHIQFCDAPSGKNNPHDAMKTLYWGEDTNDRIYHAGVSNTKISLLRDGFVEAETTIDYMKDGATNVGNASPEEYQFITSVVDNELQTEKVVRSGGTTGKTQRPMTERELEEERVKREKAVDMAMDKAIKFVEKGEAKMVEPKEEKTNKQTEEDGAVVEEIYTNQDEIDNILQECEENKARGNEAFGNGEYAQAVLLYTLALDKADELPDDKSRSKLFPCHIVLSNRSASFLKLGEHEKALADATRAVKMEPTYVKASFRKGLALHAMGKYSEALPVLAQAQKLEPKNKQIKQALQFAEVRMNQEMRKRME